MDELLREFPGFNRHINTMNKILISGILADAPKRIVEYGIEIIQVPIKVKRPHMNKEELLTVISKDVELINKVLKDDLHKGDLFMVTSGYIETVIKKGEAPWQCDYCLHENYYPYSMELMNIIFVQYQFARNFENERSEIGLNEVYITGIVNTAPVSLPSPTVGNNYSRAKFKLAVPMNLYGEMRTQYPYIVSFGERADFAINTIKEEDMLLIYGTIQERFYLKEKNIRCECCHNKTLASIYLPKREIIASRYEFIHGNEKIERKFSESLNQDGNPLPDKQEQKIELTAFA